MFDFDATGIDPNTRGVSLLPKAWFNFEIIRKTSKDGKKEWPIEGYTKEHNYPKVDLVVAVTNQGDYNGKTLFHSVTFMPKEKSGSGIAIHFLKTIGEPWEGKISPNPDAWVGKQFKGFVIVDEYNGKKRNKLSEIKTVEKVDDTEIPF